jgi:dienelactone hydrolase
VDPAGRALTQVFRRAWRGAKRRLRRAAIPVLLATGLATSIHASGAPLAIDDAFARRATGQLALSPDGAHIAVMAATKDALAVLLLDADTFDAKTLYGSKALYGAPYRVRWIGREILAVQTTTGILTFTLDGVLQRRIPGIMMAAIPGEQPGHEAVFVYDYGFYKKVGVRSSDSGYKSVDVPYYTSALLFDEHGVARVASAQRSAVWSDDTNVTYWYRATEADDWRRLAEFPIREVQWRPVSVSKDGHSLVVLSREGRDTYAAFRYDVDTHDMTELLAGHPREDIAGWETTDEETFAWVKTSGLKPTIHWFDAHGAATQKAVDAAIPDRINNIVGDAGKRALVFSYGDVDPGSWYLLDSAKGELRKIAAANPQVKAEALRPARTVTYRTADGFDVPAYLTVPEGADRNLPTVVLVHGGPVARDQWGFDAEVQLLASRGYAVFQPQFRGSTGFGKRFEEAGFNQWGRAMQDDVTAGTQWLIDQGVADPKRICIFGGSYGGYAAMWAMVKTPDLFRCGISLAGVSDVNEMFADGSDVNGYAVGRLFAIQIIGDPKKMHDTFDSVSPLKHAAEFKAPVLIAHGDRDRRVPESHSKALVAALQANHKKVEWIELPDEAHSLSRPENQRRFFGALFDFLDRYIGPASVAAQ